LKNKQSKKIFNIKEFLNKSKKNQNQLFSSQLQKTESIPFLLKTLSTAQAIYNQPKNKYLIKSPSLNFSPRSRIPTLSLTETELLNNNIIIDSTNKNLYSNSKKDDIFKTNFFPKTPDYKDRNKKDNDGIFFLLNIQKEVNKYKLKKKPINLELKIKELNKKEHGPKTMIKKIKSYKFLQYLASYRKEGKISLKEEYQTKIDYIQEKINSQQKALQLFNIKFINKMANYVKYLDSINT
jgi:hypothetical protein